jgi:predicted DNA-binding ribbon-helix-helix protein
MTTRARIVAAGDQASAGVVKRSLVIAGHRTSVSLEDAFWRALASLAAVRGQSIAGLAAEIDATRGDANLSSAIRVYLFEVAVRPKSE